MSVIEDRKQMFRRAAGGAALALALYFGGAWFVYGLDFFGGGWTAWNPLEVWHLLFVPAPIRQGASVVLIALFGAEAGCATLPFAEEGKKLVLRSGLHFLAMAATLMGWLALNLADPLGDCLPWLLALVLLYVTIWLVRWVGWYAELTRIREKLGLPGGHGQKRHPRRFGK